MTCYVLEGSHTGSHVERRLSGGQSGNEIREKAPALIHIRADDGLDQEEAVKTIRFRLYSGGGLSVMS